jgi:RNA polymerase sigma-70 factor (sigma-E family)
VGVGQGTVVDTGDTGDTGDTAQARGESGERRPVTTVAPDPPPTPPEPGPVPTPAQATGSVDLEALYVDHAGALLRLAGVLVRDRATAEDVVHEAFVRVAVAGGRLRDPDRAGAYLRATVVNLCRNRWRHRAVVDRHPPEPPAHGASAEDDAQRDAERREVVEAVRSLPTRQRECLVLRHWMGLNETQIAATLGITGGSVKTHMKRGMAALERRLGSSRPGGESIDG